LERFNRRQGTIKGTQLAMKYMGQNNYGGKLSSQRGGVVLNVSSIQGLLSFPAMPAYSAGKSGIIQVGQATTGANPKNVVTFTTKTTLALNVVS
jgi:NAD(P)-dependent dehydrogenase (short-subunit alcohol dehydrogenase family)